VDECIFFFSSSCFQVNGLYLFQRNLDQLEALSKKLKTKPCELRLLLNLLLPQGSSMILVVDSHTYYYLNLQFCCQEKITMISSTISIVAFTGFLHVRE
jgi:hypothetical protein